MACDALERAESQHTTSIAEHISDQRLHDAYAASEGLCLLHFRQVLRAAPDAAEEGAVAPEGVEE